ncbi:MAG: hypothetical protein JW807_12365 [Spirochaetes bacterium]|nr:hypothetical protein [Spirochaetota bacterium]
MLLVLKHYIKISIDILSNYSPLALIGISLWPVFFVLKKISWEKLPKTAAVLGLTYIQADVYSNFGILQGTIHNNQVLVEPDEAFGARITVTMHTTKSTLIELSPSRPRHRPGKNMADFASSLQAFNLVFKTRRAGKKYINAIYNDRQLFSAIKSFYDKWIFQLENFSVIGNEIRCIFNYGLPICAYMPAGKMKEAVNDLIALAESFRNIQSS